MKNTTTCSVSSVQSLSCVWLFVTPWIAACQTSLSITNSQSLLKLMSIELVMPSNHLILCHPLLFLPSIFPSIRVFSTESVLHIMWPNWSFTVSISLSNEYSGLISFRIDWLDLLYVQGTLKSLHNITIQKHQFFSAQPSLRPTLTSVHDYWKTIAFTIWTFPITYKKAFQCNIQKSKFSRMYYGILINVINMNYFVSIQIDVIMLDPKSVKLPMSA